MEAGGDDRPPPEVPANRSWGAAIVARRSPCASTRRGWIAGQLEAPVEKKPVGLSTDGIDEADGRPATDKASRRRVINWRCDGGTGPAGARGAESY